MAELSCASRSASNVAQRIVGGIADAAGIARLPLGRGIGAQALDLTARGDDVGMRLAPAPGKVLGDLPLQLGDLAGGGAAIVATDTGDGLRRRGELGAHRGDRGGGGGDLRLEPGDLGARGVHAVADRAAAGERAHEALLELDHALLGLAQGGLAGAQLLVEHFEALAGLAPVAGHVLLLEGVDQALDGAGRGARVLRVGEAGNVRAGLDLEAAVGLLRHRDPGAQSRDDRGEVAVAGDERVEIGAADDAGQILVRDEGLLQPQHLGVAVLDAAAGQVGENLLLLDEQPRLRLVAVRDQGDDQPAEHGHAPGDERREPAAAPHLVQGDPDLGVKSVHYRQASFGSAGGRQNMLSGMMMTSPGSSRTLARMSPRRSRSAILRSYSRC